MSEKLESHEIDILNAAVWYAHKLHQEIIAKRDFEVNKATVGYSLELFDAWQDAKYEREQEAQNLLEKAKKANRLIDKLGDTP